MGQTARNRALVCDDDELLRGIVRRMLEDVGYEVLAEVDSPGEAMNALDTSAVDLIILDLALRSGHGEELLAWLRTRGSQAKVVVFSAYISDPDALLAAGTTVTVEKPDFARLEDVARQLLDTGEAAPAERRRSNRPVTPLPAPAGTSLSGFEPWSSFCGAAAALSPGDAVLALDVRPTAALRPVWDAVFRIDHRMALGRALADTKRPVDRVSVSPDLSPVLLLVAGRPEAPLAVFDRIEANWDRDVRVSVPVGVFGHVGADTDPAALLERVLVAIRSPDTTVESGLRSL